MVGKTLSHFRIVEKLGEGGMGVVYRAEDVSLRRPVALKVLPPELVADEERRLRFLREGRAAAAVTHPNIATVYEVGEAEGQVFIAMELVEGRPLSAMIGGRPLSIKDALRIGTEIAEGLARAHRAGIIHRDLKPANVVIAEDGHAKILDFGLAKLLEKGVAAGDPAGGGSDLSRRGTISTGGTRAGTVLGTAAYMSPEQARGEEVDARADLFALGATLYEMATGGVPFRGRTGMDTLGAILIKEPASLRSVNSQVPLELERVVLKCLKKDREERYQHADEVAVDLREIRGMRESGAQAAPLRRRLTPKAGLAPAAGIALAVLLAALFLLDVGGLRRRVTGGPGAGRVDSLAVLPLRNLSGDPGQEYFSDGMTEELTATLARIHALKVISSTSAMYYKGKQKPLREIAAELDVDALVEGSVMRSGERVRVTAQLVEGATDRHLWAASYERDLKNVLALQSEVARAIAEEVKAVLTPGEKTRLAGARPVDPEAYEHYLKGRHLRGKLTAEGLTRAIEEFQRAMEKDPNYAPAHADLAYAYLYLSYWSVTPSGEAYPKARAAALRALELDPELAEAYAALGSIKFGFERDWVGAESEFRKAIELNPNDAIAHAEYALYLAYQGQEDEALGEARQAHLLDPLSPMISFDLAFVYLATRRYDEALAQCRRLLELHPDNGPARDVIAELDVEMGRHEEGIASLRKRLGNPDAEVPFIMATLVRAYAHVGKKAEAQALMPEILQLSERRYYPPSYIAFAYGALGEQDRAFMWLERALKENDPLVVTLKVFPWWDSLRSDSRFADILRRAGFPED